MSTVSGMRYRGKQGFNPGPIGFLIILNLILYIATSISPELFIGIFAFRPVLSLAMPWTVLTSMFIHQPFPDFWHIVANMLTLYFFGSYLLGLVGEKRFFIIYFIGGIIGNIFFMLWALFFGGVLGGVFYVFQASIFSTVYGASGAVFAVAGVLVAMSPRLKVFIIPIPVPLPLWVAVIGGFLVISFFPFVAWQAHLGGLVVGLVSGYFFRRRERRF